MQDSEVIKRYTFSMSEKSQTRLAEIAKQVKLTQGEVIESLIETMGQSEDAVWTHMIERRRAKVENRTSPWAVYQREKEQRARQEQAAEQQ